MRPSYRGALAACVASVAGACGSEGDPARVEAPAAAAGSPWFEEIHARAGVDFVHRSGADAGRLLFPEIMGGGVALLDVEGDGDLDLYLVQGGDLEHPDDAPGNALYLNDGGAVFTDVSAASGADDRGHGMGVATGDADQDGRTDLYVTNVGPNVLLLNAGEGTFAAVPAVAGAADPAWSTSAAFLDVDADGDLDLFVCDYVDWAPERELECFAPSGLPDYCSPRSYAAPLPDRLYLNDGTGAFADGSERAGLLARRGNGLGVVAGDLDRDGRIDVFVANDQTENHLWHNEGGGRLREIGGRAGVATAGSGAPRAGMGTLAEDVDDDGDLDLLVVNLRGQADSYFRNEGGLFEDRTEVVGLGAAGLPFTRFGVGAPDLDNDGHLDLFVANGRVTVVADAPRHGTDPYAEPNLLLAGVPGGGFRAVRPAGGLESPPARTSRGAAFGDLDSDGGVDAVVVNKDAHPCVLRNVVPARGHWLALRVVDATGRDALGAELTLPLGDRTLRRDVRSAYGYCSASDPRVHVGLGARTEVPEVRVRWPDGRVELFGPLAADRVAVLRAGSGRAP